ncbi:MAG: hypothetical protein Sylvanvirus17_6 [Sylvanvirus sp.]|uniref:Uncharacterized protein n=1 Tax=Sylvanvirus sp. TaxID=2487774 RepID=A0A3G5AIF9_9VIRU|nr:MAG: hypothetical protein Sylvanvirus17_6 [Sylvanvirus sp.]
MSIDNDNYLTSITAFTVYKTPDGRNFESIEEAKKHVEAIRIEKAKLELATMKDFITASYDALGLLTTVCQCQSARVTCLLHLCTCDKLKICDRHTNVILTKSKGCYWCKYTDCNKNKC